MKQECTTFFAHKKTKKHLNSIIICVSRFAQPYKNAQPFLHNLCIKKVKSMKTRTGLKTACRWLVKAFKDLIKKRKIKGSKMELLILFLKLDFAILTQTQ